MALERAMLLSQQKLLIQAQNALEHSANVVVQPDQNALAKNLIQKATIALDLADERANQADEILTRLQGVGFMDVPLDTFAERLRQRPSQAEDGAIARIIEEASATEDELAIKATEKGLLELRQGNREEFRLSNQDASNHSTIAENIATEGRAIVEEFGDFPIEELLIDLNSKVVEIPESTSPKKADSSKEKVTKLKRGERFLIILQAVLGLGAPGLEIARSLDDLVAIVYDDKKSDFPDSKRLVGNYRGSTKSDLKRVITLIDSPQELDSALIDSGIKQELQKIQADPKLRALSVEEKTTLAFREAGWQSILAKVRTESLADETEKEDTLDINNTPLAILIKKIKDGETQGHQPDSQTPLDFTSFQERIWWRAFDLIREGDQIKGFKNESFDDVVLDVFSREIKSKDLVPESRKQYVKEKTQAMIKNLVIALDKLAANLPIPRKIHSLLSDFEQPKLEGFYWLTPLELGQVIRRELDFERVKEIVMQRWLDSVSPEQADSYIKGITGE